MRFQVTSKLIRPNSWITQTVRQRIPNCWARNGKSTSAESAATDARNALYFRAFQNSELLSAKAMFNVEKCVLWHCWKGNLTCKIMWHWNIQENWLNERHFILIKWVKYVSSRKAVMLLCRVVLTEWTCVMCMMHADVLLTVSCMSAGRSLLTPTRIYVGSTLSVMRSGLVKAAAHITGGGLPGNIVRVLPDSVAVHLDASLWTMPPVFGWISHMVSVCIAYLLDSLLLYLLFHC